MPSQSIALIPAFGYQNIQPSSYKAFILMKHVSIANNIYIEHARNGKEKKIEQYKLDGWCEATNTGYEFHGCVYHGCPKCFNLQSFNPVLHESMESTYKKHKKRIDFLKQHINLVEMWECEYNTKLKNDVFFALFEQSQRDIRPPLNPRDALSGGRTNAIELYYKGKAGYIDFTSLYPCIQKYGVFPIGHPKIITENFGNIDSYFGLIYCKVLPPTNLYLPVLPYHANGKLIFPLCASCAKLNQSNCNHLPNERELEGTWVTLEMIEAVKRGYTITQIYEIWHFELKETYDKSNKAGGLFTKYVDTFLKIKQEASGYPDWIKTEEDKNIYISNYLQHEGILLDKDNIKVNPGLKAISKLLLNSQWGRYAMQTNKTQAKFVTSILELSNIFEKADTLVKDVLFPNDEVAIVFSECLKEMHWGSNQTNVVIAAFVTCQARIKLFLELEKLGDRVLYFDTDSIIYKKNAIYEPKIGDYLGEFTNEIDDGMEIIEFASAGPKNYTYKITNNKTFCKVKGINLNYKNSKIINFDKIRAIVMKEIESENVQNNTIVRKKKDWSLSSHKQYKIYRMIYDKRILFDDLKTLPFGYKF